MLSHFSYVWLIATLWTVVHQAPLSMRFCRQEYWGGFPCPPSGDLPNPGIKSTSPASPALQVDSLPTEPPGNRFRSGSVQFSCSVVSDTFWRHGLQHTRLPCPSPTPKAYSNSRPSCQWCHPTISSTEIPFSHLPSFLPSGSFLMSRFFALGGQNIGISASASVLPMNIQDWFPLGLTGWISLLSKGLSRVLSNTTVQNHQFFGAQLSL